MSAHTPGPWHLRKSLTGSDYLHVSSQTIDRIAAVNRSEDAHLIAAAPTLLAELEHLMRLLQPLEQSGELQVPGLATLNGARAAIAQARGEA